MTRIFEALQQAASEGAVYGAVVDFPRRDRESLDDATLEKIMGLYRAIQARSDNVIQFVGAEPGAGTSRLLRTLAKTAANAYRKSVLIIDADPRSGQFAHFSIDPAMSWGQAIRARQPIEAAYCQVEQTDLYLSQAFSDPASASVFLDPAKTAESIQGARETFDLVLVDSVPASESPSGISASALVDGTAIVVEAEKTRWQVVGAMKEKILRQGGRILGVILNGQRHYIPEIIYRQL